MKIFIYLGTLLAIYKCTDGNTIIGNAFSTLGWKNLVIISHNNTLDKDVMSLSRNGYYVSRGDNLCSLPIAKRFYASLDGTAVDMKIFNRTMLQDIIQCGISDTFKNMLIMTSDSLTEVTASLAMQKTTIGPIGLLVPKMKLLRIIKMAFSNRAVVMPYLSSEFDLGGLQLECYNLPYPPVIQYECQGKICSVSGTYPQLVSNLGERFNFTTVYHMDKSGKWGSPSKLGANISSVLKTLHDGNSAFSFSWVGTYERLRVFDHILGIPMKMDMYMMPSGQKVSWDMVFKPFTRVSWALIITFLCLAAVLYKLLSTSPLLKQSEDIKCCVALLIGLFVTTLSSFYDGAMIIALTTNQPLPFENVLDGLARPDWDLSYYEGAAGLYKPFFDMIPDGEEKSRIVLSPDYKYSARNREEKFQFLRNSKTFLLEDRDRAANFLRNTKCQSCKDAFRFGRAETKDSGFLFEKHSPLREVFKIGLIQMREAGVIDNIKQSLGPDYVPMPTHTVPPITLQLSALMFLFLGSAATVICPFVLIMEYIWQSMANKFTVSNEVKSCQRIYEEGTCHHCGFQQIRQVCIRRISI